MTNLNTLSFFSKHPIDKIVATGTKTITNNGATTNYWDNCIVTSTQTNTYGKRVFARATWSVDNGVSWQSLEGRNIYSFTVTDPGGTATLTGLKAGISIGSDDSNIQFITANGYHGNVTYSGGSYIYTPVSQTFIIKWALFEVK